MSAPSPMLSHSEPPEVEGGQSVSAARGRSRRLSVVALAAALMAIPILLITAIAPDDALAQGAGDQAIELYQSIAGRIDDGASMADATAAQIDDFTATRSEYLPGFGHRFHPVDPRAPRLLELVDSAAREGAVSGRFAEIGRALEAELKRRKGKTIPMNIDGATAVIYAELDFPAPLARGLFCLSRSVGILAHAWEQTQQGGRNKGPIPRQYTWTYDGPSKRRLPDDG